METIMCWELSMSWQDISKFYHTLLLGMNNKIIQASPY